VKAGSAHFDGLGRNPIVPATVFSFTVAGNKPAVPLE
jgi:hypothetical protein